MKKISVIALFFLATSTALAQMDRPSWYVGLGMNAVSYKTNERTGLNASFSAFRGSVGTSIGNNFNVEASFAFNTIENFANQGRKFEHTAADFMFWYSMSSLVNNSRYRYYRDADLFDPYLGVGAGMSWLSNPTREQGKAATLNATAGINFWITNNFAFVTQGSYKHSADAFLDQYYEVVVGVRYKP